MPTDGIAVLVPVDVDESAESILSIAREMKEIGVQEVQLLHVVHPVDVLAVPNIIDTRKEILIGYKKKLIEDGISIVTGEVVIGTPWMEIAARARSDDIAFILMGSQGKDLLKRVFLGSQTENILYHTDRTLFILRLQMKEERFQLIQEHLFTQILFATDLSEGAQRGIPYLERMASISEQLTLVYVEDVRHFEYASIDNLRRMRDRSEKELTALKDHFLNKGYKNVDIVYRKGNAIRELLDVIAELQPSLLVMGAKGTYDIAERALGGVAETLLHSAPVHILLCRR